jgi:GDP/UDP-N,N'-diacetylbacillosamine 2-epimerase (hydrolysing)
MQTIIVFSSGRWDYGHLFWIIKGISESEKISLLVVAPENHHNIKEIMLNFPTRCIRPINGINDAGKVYEDCLNIFQITKPTGVFILGDRYESCMVALAATVTNTKIIHAHGGETTEGAFDNEIRNAITQMATYHFTAMNKFTERVKEMLSGYPGWNQFLHSDYNEYWYGKHRVYTVGSPGLDWLTRSKLLYKQELQQHVLIDLNRPFVMACFHSVTKELSETERQVNEFMNAVEQLDEQILLIGENIDPGSEIVHERVWRKSHSGKNIIKVSNLDHLVYLSLLQYASFMIGNSSSGIIESASFNIPSVSVGNRQKGRIRNSNTLDCPCETQAILDTVDRAREWNSLIGKCENVYGDGKSVERIIRILEDI